MDTIGKNNLPECINELFEKIQGLLRKAEVCQYLINNYNVLSNEYLIAGLHELAPNILMDEDYYRIISKYYGKEYYMGMLIRRKINNIPVPIPDGYHGPINIKTTLYERVLGEDKYYHDMGVILNVLYTSVVSKFVYYSEERIQKLLDEGKIVILNKKYNPEGAPFIAVPPQECPDYELAFSDVDHKEFFSSDGKYYQTTLDYIKDKLDVEALTRLRDHILTLIANEMGKASFLQEQFDKRGFQKRLNVIQRK